MVGRRPKSRKRNSCALRGLRTKDPRFAFAIVFSAGALTLFALILIALRPAIAVARLIGLAVVE